MAKLLVVENTVPLRQFLRLHLETAGHQVRVAENASAALAVAAEQRPDLILAGIGSNEVDCQRVVAQLRSCAELVATPVILLALRSNEASLRAAQRSGAVEYLSLPVTRDQLLRAVSSHLPEHLRDNAAELASEDLLAGGLDEALLEAGTATTVGIREHARFTETVLPERPRSPTSGIGLEPTSPYGNTALASQERRSGTVVFADIRNFSALAEMLNTEELADLLNVYFVRACEPILQHGGWIVKLLGDGILAMFEARPAGPGHAERALKAALCICVVAQGYDEWLKGRFPDRVLPSFALGIGVHTGDVMVCRINTGAGVDTTIVGDTVNVASRLEQQTKKLGASVVTSLETLSLAGPRFIPGKRGSLVVRGRVGTVEITEITGLRPRPDVNPAAVRSYSLITEAVARNTAIIQRERSRVLAEPHRISHAGDFAPMRPEDAPVKIPGFKLLKRLADGGMSRLFLGEYESTGSLRMLKVLNVSEGGVDLLRRFVQEHELISNIRHPRVATIFGHGQTDSNAYIVMEYLPGGDLRHRLEQGLAPEQALAFVEQIVDALVAIHSRGIVHRDMRPDNFMLREDGTLVLADFGIAKDLSRTMSNTRRGEGLGTPYYLSPEQATGVKVDQRCDLYSVGVMFYEMLTGQKPYMADDPFSLLHKHLHDPLPHLPEPLAAFQGLLDRLMAKSPDDRYASSAEALAAIRGMLNR